MEFTFDHEPTKTARDACRMLCGDVVEKKKSLSDGEIAFFLTQKGITSATSPSTDYTALYFAAAECAEALAARYSDEAHYSVGGMSESANQKAREYRNTAKRLRKQAATGALPFVGGRSKAEKETAAEDSDLPQATFKRGMMEVQSSQDDLAADDA